MGSADRCRGGAADHGCGGRPARLARMIHMDAAPGTHPTINLGCGTLCTLNYDSVISSALAVVVTIGVGFWLRAQLREGEPTRVQAIFELGYDQLLSLIKSNVCAVELFIISQTISSFMYVSVADVPELP